MEIRRPAPRTSGSPRGHAVHPGGGSAASLTEGPWLCVPPSRMVCPCTSALACLRCPHRWRPAAALGSSPHLPVFLDVRRRVGAPRGAWTIFTPRRAQRHPPDMSPPRRTREGRGDRALAAATGGDPRREKRREYGLLRLGQGELDQCGSSKTACSSRRPPSALRSRSRSPVVGWARARRATRCAGKLPSSRRAAVPPRSLALHPIFVIRCAWRRFTTRRESTASPTKISIDSIDHALLIEDAGEDPDRWLVIGPDRAGNLLEVVVLTTAEATQIAIHAMPMRAKFHRLLEP